MNNYAKEFIDEKTLIKDKEKLEQFYIDNTEDLSFINDENLTLTATRLKVDDPVNTLVIIPGRGEIAHKFYEFFYTLHKLKIEAVVIFARGQAASSRILKDKNKCHIERFEDFAKDICFVLEKLNIENYKLLAFSLGGLISLDIIKNMKRRPSKAALIAPYIWPYFKLPDAVLKPFVFIAGTLPFVRTMYTPHGKEYKRLEFIGNHHAQSKTRFENYHDYFAEHKEIAIGGPTFHFVKEAMKKQLELLNSNFEFNIDIYCQSAGKDKVVSTEKAKEFFLKHKDDKCPPRFEIIENCFHDLINESDEYRIDALAKALEFLFD